MEMATVMPCQSPGPRSTRTAAHGRDGGPRSLHSSPPRLADHLAVVPDEHASCEAGYVMDKLVAVASRYSSGGASRAATGRTPRGSRPGS